MGCWEDSPRDDRGHRGAALHHRLPGLEPPQCLPAEAHSFLALGIQIAWSLLPPWSMQSLIVSQYIPGSSFRSLGVLGPSAAVICKDCR